MSMSFALHGVTPDEVDIRSGQYAGVVALGTFPAEASFFMAGDTTVERLSNAVALGHAIAAKAQARLDELAAAERPADHIAPCDWDIDPADEKADGLIEQAVAEHEARECAA